MKSGKESCKMSSSVAAACLKLLHLPCVYHSDWRCALNRSECQILEMQMAGALTEV